MRDCFLVPSGLNHSEVAGLWWSTILTTATNDDMARLHDRMPVILEGADWPVWLGEAEGDHLALMRPAESGVVRLWPVSRAVNSVGTMGRSCWAAVMIPTRAS